MASKIAKQAMAGAHTAGIYADMSVDGPEIGTLVVVLDRAKNLPNRKTMGKQDPYCACRLGKEAKKTETDKRGGQTPKWDQELRFTVHDSLDYHQLKVSIFNDDKKTDLIGETWVELDSVLKLGGGKNELWHTLNCKGRYAGDIRIELTFYDSRPKDESAVEAVSIALAPSQRERTPEALGGPRQAKQVKRRPLPADPTSTDPSPARPTMPDHAQSSPLPYTPSHGQQGLHGPSPHSASASAHLRRFDSSPAVGHGIVTPPRMDQQYSAHYDEPPFIDSASSYQGHSVPRDELHLPAEPSQSSYGDGYVEQYQGTQVDNQPDYRQDSRPLPQHQSPYQNQGIELPELPPHTPRTNRSSAHASPRYYSPADSSPTYTLPQYRPSPDLNRQRDPRESARYSGGHSPLTKGDYYQESPLRHRSFNEEDQSQSNTVYPSIEDDGPPLPPTHRGSGMGLPSHREEHDFQNNYAPAPLNIRNPRASLSASPLAQICTELPSEDYGRSASPTESRFSSRSAPMIPYQDPYGQPRRLSDRDSEPFLQHPYPLQTGKAYQEAEPYGQFNSYENTPSPNQFQSYDPRTSSAVRNGIDRDHRVSNNFGPGYENRLHRERASTYDSRHSYPLRPLDDNSQRHDDGQSPRSHRGSVPLIKPRAISPDPRTPMRKSVSPQPASTRSDGLSGVPFSPDSYDQLNPNLKNARSINSLGPRYTTPEGIREAARDREKEEKLASSGPIIDSKGRVIDPSDHLPSDTWAPEPERKTVRKTHEVKLKFRNSPQGAQPMPPRVPRDMAARPHSIATALPAQNPPPPQQQHLAYQSPTVEDGSPTSASRARLQKRARGAAPQPVHFHSSPAVPMGSHQPSPQQQQAYNTLCEYPGYGFNGNGNGNPGYGRGAGGTPLPPPVPAKVPVGAGQEDWGRDSLSEEIGRIDIGVGGDRRGMAMGRRGMGMGRFG